MCVCIKRLAEQKDLPKKEKLLLKHMITNDEISKNY